jgi:hypothetical protein
VKETVERRRGEPSAAARDEGVPARAAPLTPLRSVQYPDLGATVHLGSVPDGLADELPALYESLFSTLDWFLLQEHRVPNGACVLEEPRHVVLFWRKGVTAHILNKAFHCEPADANRIRAALFRAMPGVRCLRLDVMFPPEALTFPFLVRGFADCMVIDLPESVDAYYHSLSKNTRKNVRRRQNQLARDFPGLSTEMVSPGERSQELVDRLVGWKVERFRRKGLLAHWELDPASRRRAGALLRSCGQALVTSVDGEEVGIQLTFRVGDTAYAFQNGIDPRFEAYSLGFLTFYRLVCHAIETGAKRVNALDTYESSKRPLGAHPVRTSSLSVFRSRLSQLRSPREMRSIARERYWLARHALGQWLRRSPRGMRLAAAITRFRLRRFSSDGG